MPTSDESVSAAEVTDLRSAMDLLRSMPGELVTTDRLVDPNLEIAGIYKRVGAGTPARPPTRVGPALFLTNVKGCGMPVVTGILASQQRTARLLGSTVEGLPSAPLEALEHPVAPVTVAAGEAPCQQVVLRPPFDLRRVLPTLTMTALDAGPRIPRPVSPT